MWVAAVLGAGCGNVMNPGADAAKGQPDAAAADAAPQPDAMPAMGTSCADILAKTPGAPSGTYVIDPDGPGGVAPFSVICQMDVLSGGWTQVTDRLAATLSSTVGRQYMYLYGATGALSPCTDDAWSWAPGGAELAGTYAYFDDTGETSTIACTGSDEKPAWGVGCSNGGGPFDKVLPIYVEDPAGGVSEVCVTATCEYAAVIFEKEGCTP